ncbi:N-6 DNA methylase [Lonepinella koalarum]|uniref:N-6 DNA methylase n=1 Tax=Lonepinella koalarum TaxID=53417 RepID=UPI0011E3CE04|nr:N-6 DNA methylase [Lonepinella koalarum]TYG33275.1 N-6 DNA methylase [Lonepinella koalarum]
MKITELLNLKWNYQMTEELMALLFDKEKCLDAFNRYMAAQPDLTQDCFLAEFQESFAERSALKQDYTPSSICQITAALSGQAETVLDVCCGTGALTIAKWSVNPNATFYLEEYSKEAVAILLFNLAVRGINAEVKNCDVLTGEVFASYKLVRHGKYSSIEQVPLDWSQLQVDAVISNPPYSATWLPKNDERFAEYGLAPKTKADYAFLLHGLHYLKENGTASFILPHGVLFRGQTEGTIRQKLIDKNYLDAVIGLPPKLFLATDIPVALLILKKQRATNDIYFIDGSDLFIKQKTNNIMEASHIKRIIDTYQQRCDVDKLASIVSLNTIQSNDYNLNLPRYVDKAEPPVIPDFLKEAQELLNITKETEKANQQFLTLLYQLEITGTKQQIDEFEQAKECLRQAFAPRQFKTQVLKKIQSLNPDNYQATLFDYEELQEIDSFIIYKQKQIETLQNIKTYFRAKMFV